MIRTKGLSVMLLIWELLLGLVEFLCLSGCGNKKEHSVSITLNALHEKR